MNDVSAPPAAFDAYAENYDEALTNGLAVSGEDKMYFARGRVAWVARLAADILSSPSTVLDFGCGTGSASALLVDSLGAQAAVCVDSSPQSIARARRDHGAERLRFMTLAEYRPDGHVDLAYCNGVFHHIPPAGRAAAVAYVYAALRPGGLFAFWENNPWNPGTRYVMSRIPFDRDAVTLTAPEARRLLRDGGFVTLRTDFLFIFPRVLARLRWLETRLVRAPLGAQYLVLCQKPIERRDAVMDPRLARSGPSMAPGERVD